LRRLRPTAKDYRAVSLPFELRDSLLIVADRIREATLDPDVELDFDDAIQTDVVCGGRDTTKRRPYVLTFFPPGGDERARWFLSFDRSEIEDIADGRLTELGLYCCVAPECGCKFREPDEHCAYCDYVDDPRFGCFIFPEAAVKLAECGVEALSEDSSKDVVIALLGEPDECGGGYKHQGFGYVWPWIKYRRPDCQLRIEFFKEGKRIRNVSVMEKDWLPGGSRG
jgi:hypothetical protein